MMRGAYTPPPRMEAPVIRIPQAAPTTDREMANAMPKLPHMYGLVELIILFVTSS